MTEPTKAFMAQGWAMNQLQYMNMVNEGIYVGASLDMTESEFIKLLGFAYEASNGAAILESQTDFDYYDLLHAEWHRLHKSYNKNKTGVVTRHYIEADDNGVIQKVGLSLDPAFLIRPVMTDMFWIGIHEIMLFLSMSQALYDGKQNRIKLAREHSAITADILLHGKDLACVWDGSNIKMHIYRMDNV